jgi:NADH dehydrogenase
MGPVVVFGGTGFLGRRVVRRLRAYALPVRVAARHPERAAHIFGHEDAELTTVAADIHDERSIELTIAGATAVVNAVSLYGERGRETFQSVHVQAAGRLARLARQARVERLLHLSGIGADSGSTSAYIRSRGQGERAVRDAFPAATLIRPAVMFGPDDAFLSTILLLLRRLPVYPMFGRGTTRLQPVHVEDVAEAIARGVARDEGRGATFEFGGPRVYTYQQLLETVARVAGLHVALLPVPFAAWHALAGIAAALPKPALTRSQVELMEIDTVVSDDAPGLAALGIRSQELEAAVAALVPSRTTA